MAHLNPIFVIYPDGRWVKLDTAFLPGENAEKREDRMFAQAQQDVGGDIELVKSIIPGCVLMVDEDAGMKSMPPPVNALASLLCHPGVRMAFGLRGPVVLARAD